MRAASILVLSTVATAIVFAVSKDVLAKYEEPAYEVVLKEGPMEIRSYPAVLAAQVSVNGIGNDTANQAFSILAAYIFGKNEGKKKISMTVPVTEQLVPEKIAMTVPVVERLGNESMTMRFFMPRAYSLENLPKPKDSRIEFVNLSPAKIAVIKFSGMGDEDNFKRHADLLLEKLQNTSFKISGEPLRAFYNPPWTLPPFRRNEIWIPVI